MDGTPNEVRIYPMPFYRMIQIDKSKLILAAVSGKGRRI